MLKMEKRIDTKNGKIIYQKLPNGYITFFKITYINFNKENNPEKRLQFSMRHDFQFERAPKEYNLLDLEKIEFHDSVRKTFLSLANRFKDRYVIIDASKPFDEVVEDNVFYVLIECVLEFGDLFIGVVLYHKTSHKLDKILKALLLANHTYLVTLFNKS